MSVCPLDFRYGQPEMKRIFSEESKLQRLLDVEAALASAHAKLGTIPKADAEAIVEAAASGRVTVEKVRKIEDEIRHDIMAVARALTEESGAGGRFVHLGATSNDIIDTASALQFRDGLEFVSSALKELAAALAKLAERHARTVMVGRTHGQWAVPTTFGLKMAVFASEVVRHLARIDEIRDRVCVGKMMGAVGTGAGLGPRALQLQTLVMGELGLGVPTATTQVVSRDRHVELVATLANVATSMEKFATEVRNLQRPEIGEVREAFDVEKFVGSSTMAHKRNPEVSEKVCGLARVARANLVPMHESAVLWHERDLSNSSAERFILPHTFILVHECVVSMTKVFAALEVFPESMTRNLAATRGLIMAEPVMLALVDRGMGRQEAHEIIRRCSMAAEDSGRTLKDALESEPQVARLLSGKALDEVLDYGAYIGSAEQIVKNAVAEVRARE